MSKQKPGFFKGLWDLFTLANIRNKFAKTKCDNCEQFWSGNYAYKYFNYCYTCGSEIGDKNE